MTLPAVTVSKAVFTTAQAPASSAGILAIIAASSTGTPLVPGAFSRTDLAQNAFGQGPLVEYGAYDIDVANEPVVLMKQTPTFPGSYAGLDTSGVTGSSVITTAGNPYDHYAVVVVVGTGGTVGTAGITLTWSLDGGQIVSGAVQLGTATSYTIPNSGVTFNMTSASLNAGDTWTVRTERPLLNDADTTAALAVMGNTRLPFEGILIDSSMTTSTVGLIDTILQSWERRGMFKFVLINTRFKGEPEPGAEDEATYAAAITTLVQNQTSIRECVGADGAHVPSPITGYNLKRPTSLLLGARAMSIANIPGIGTDPAWVALGPLTGAQIADNKGNPLDHDEDLFPNLDSQRVTTCRSFAPGGPQGVYFTNANAIQPSGGAFPYLQHIRIANRACEIAWSVLTTQLSRGVRKNPKADPITGAVYIFEPDAAVIEQMVNDALIQPLKGQVTSALFSLSRTDNLAVVPAVVTGLLDIVANAYIKGYNIQQQFTKTLVSAL